VVHFLIWRKMIDPLDLSLSPFWRPSSRWTWVCRYRNVSILHFIAAKDDGSGGDNWRSKKCKAPVTTSKPTPSFLQAYYPVISVRALKERIWRDKPSGRCKGFHAFDGYASPTTTLCCNCVGTAAWTTCWHSVWSCYRKWVVCRRVTEFPVTCHTRARLPDISTSTRSVPSSARRTCRLCYHGWFHIEWLLHKSSWTIVFSSDDSIWDTGIRGLMRGMTTFPQGNQELLVVKGPVRAPGL